MSLIVTIGTARGRHWAEVDLPDGPLRVAGVGAGSPIPVLARVVADRGVSRLQRMTVVRENGTQAFAPAEVGWWADRAVRESDRESARFVKYAPFDREVIEQMESER